MLSCIVTNSLFSCHKLLIITQTSIRFIKSTQRRFTICNADCKEGSSSQFKVSIWPSGFLRYWYLKISIPKEVFYSASFSPCNQASKSAPRACPSRLAKCLGLVTDDIKNGVLAIKAACLHEFCVHAVMNYSVFWRCR